MLEFTITAGVTALTALLLLPDLIETLRLSQRAGAEGMIGKRGIALQPLAPEGWVQVRGERWSARAIGADTIAANEAVEIVAIEGIRAVVRRAPPLPEKVAERSWLQRHPVRATAIATIVITASVILLLFSSFFSVLLPFLGAGFAFVLMEEA